jgi:hypothetical protein
MQKPKLLSRQKDPLFAHFQFVLTWARTAKLRVPMTCVPANPSTPAAMAVAAIASMENFILV